MPRALALAAVLLAASGCPAARDTGLPPVPEVRRGEPWHASIVTTVFWVGEKGNESSAWCGDWVRAYGGVDDPKKRDGFHPAGFTPKENPFYCALPFNHWEWLRRRGGTYPSGFGPGLHKNRWIEIEFKDRRCYAQWEDVGPYNTDDWDYVFDNKPPKAKVGLDVSPAVRDYLGLSGRDVTRWRFVDGKNVPKGPWKEIVTTSGPNWS